MSELTDKHKQLVLEYVEIQELVAMGYITWRDGNIELTEKGDAVYAEQRTAMMEKVSKHRNRSSDMSNLLADNDAGGITTDNS